MSEIEAAVVSDALNVPWPMTMEVIRLDIGHRLPEGAQFTVDSVIPYGSSIVVLYHRPERPEPVGNTTMPVERRCCIISLKTGRSTSDMTVA